jgi:hypothetical protein
MRKPHVSTLERLQIILSELEYQFRDILYDIETGKLLRNAETYGAAGRVDAVRKCLTLAVELTSDRRVSALLHF